MRRSPSRFVQFIIFVIALGSTFPAGAWQDSKLTWSKLRTSRYKIPFPDNNFVNDFGEIIRPAEARQLRSELDAFNTRTGYEVAVVTVKNVAKHGATNVDALALDFFNCWGVGRLPANQGILILVSKDDRRMRIEVGDGWGRKLQADLAEIISADFTPAFKAGRFTEGIVAGTRSVIGLLSRPVPITERKWFKPLMSALVFAFIASVLVSYFVTGEGGWGFFWVTVLVTILMTLLEIMATPRGRRRHRYGGSSGSWSSSSGSSGGGSGSSGGGFSSGGGGASGRW